MSEPSIGILALMILARVIEGQSHQAIDVRRDGDNPSGR